MLRRWNGDSNDNILSTLKRYRIDVENISIIKYEALTPDSFVWYFTANNELYCLYAEDYIPSVGHVIDAMHGHLPAWYEDVHLELIEPEQQVIWGKSSPVASAAVYKRPEDYKEVEKYATTSDLDFVFLGKSKSKLD